MPDKSERTCAGLLLVWVDLFQLLLGLALIGYAAYAVSAAAASPQTALLTRQSLYIAFGVGGGLVVVSLLGCYISQRGASPVLRFVYFAIALACLGLSIAATIIIADYLGKITLTGAVADAARTELTDQMMSIYVSCCTGCAPTLLTGCNNPAVTGTAVDAQGPNCNIGGIPTCLYAGRCSSSLSTKGCFSANTLIPASVVDTAVCQALTTATVNSRPVVGPSTSGGCGGGNPDNFLNDMNAYFSSTWFWMEIAAAVFCGLQAIGVFCACILMCARDART